MKFTKVKLLICLCLLIVNGIFFALCVRLLSEKHYLSEQEAELAQRNLAQNGVNVNIGKEERRLYDLPIYDAPNGSEEKSISEAYRAITESFFDSEVPEDAYVKTPDGYSVSVKNDDGNVLGSSLVTDDLYFECCFEYAASDMESADISKMSDRSALDTEKDNDHDIARKFIDRALKNYDMKFVFRGTKEQGDGRIVIFSGELSDTEVEDIYINVCVRDEKIIYCGGRITDKAPQKKYSADLVDSIDALYILYDYLREGAEKNLAREISVEDITMTYRAYRYDQGKYYIIPTWVIEYTDIDGVSHTATTDAINGESISVVQKG